MIHPGEPIGAPRLIRIVAGALALGAASLIFASTEPTVGALERREDDAVAMLRSDAVVLSSIDALHAERRRLGRRFGSLLARNAEASFLADLDATTKRHDTSVVSVSTRRDDGPSNISQTPFPHVDLVLEIHGAYRALLGTVADVSRGRELVEVRSASLRRDGDTLEATIPIRVYDPSVGHAASVVTR